MAARVERGGRPAAPGLAAGPIFVVDGHALRRESTGDPAIELRAFETAVAAAIAELRALAALHPGEAADILEFQIALLSDEALLAPARDRIAAGAEAMAAWRETVAAGIAIYENTEDEYFRARVSDLRDLRDAVERHLTGALPAVVPPGAVLIGEDVPPSRFLSVDWSRGGGLALFGGSASSHVAMLARSRGVPMVVGLSEVDLTGHVDAIVDGGAGTLVLSPGAEDWARYRGARAAAAARAAEEWAFASKPARTRDGVPITVMVNISSLTELPGLDASICDGVGLVRTEFLFRDGLPDEDTQFAAYRRIVEWAAPRPVVIRTIDAGGDKPIPGFTRDGESNPLLGTRGIRLLLERVDVFRTQLRALARAAVFGDVRVLLPMVTVPSEVERAAALLDDVIAGLRAEGTPCRRPPVGIMAEVPAVAIVPELFAAAEFFSIGTNDLTQYVTAAARDTAAVSHLGDSGHPAVLRLISMLVDGAGRMGREVSLCGDAAGDPDQLPALVRAGVRTFSVAPPLVGRVKKAISTIRAKAY